ncbi:MAG: J domain-containing protein [Desulfobacterales bacterium]|nr:J domain-containing protein [Desulfobacterales bacterium]MBS3754306.1 J domain-containing protein [Desulfobacterales bacterium]
MNKYEKITEARHILELPEEATMDEIKASYRRLLARWHPDKCPEDPEKANEMTRRITAAYQTLLDYCANYRFCFSKEAVKKQRSSREWWMERFGNDPLWGGKNE